MRGACLLIDVRPELAAGLAGRLAAEAIGCVMIDSGPEDLDLSYEIGADGTLDRFRLAGRTYRRADILGSLAGPASENGPGDETPPAPARLRRAERRAALAALRALLPGCLNPPVNGALAGGLPSPVEQRALVTRVAPDLAGPIPAGEAFAEAGVACRCLFIADRQHHFAASADGWAPVQAETAGFARVRMAIGRLARLFAVDAGEVRYRYDGNLRFERLSPHFGTTDGSGPLPPAALDDLARRLAHGR